jgi:hypothetical protein
MAVDAPAAGKAGCRSRVEPTRLRAAVAAVPVPIAATTSSMSGLFDQIGSAPGAARNSAGAHREADRRRPSQRSRNGVPPIASGSPRRAARPASRCSPRKSAATAGGSRARSGEARARAALLAPAAPTRLSSGGQELNACAGYAPAASGRKCSRRGACHSEPARLGIDAALFAREVVKRAIASQMLRRAVRPIGGTSRQPGYPGRDLRRGPGSPRSEAI